MNEIALAIERGDKAFLEELPYIGAKTAERIVMELRGKMTKFALARTDQPLSIEKESASELKREALAGARTARIFTFRSAAHGGRNFRPI